MKGRQLWEKYSEQVDLRLRILGSGLGIGTNQENGGSKFMRPHDLQPANHHGHFGLLDQFMSFVIWCILKKPFKAELFPANVFCKPSCCHTIYWAHFCHAFHEGVGQKGWLNQLASSRTTWSSKSCFMSDPVNMKFSLFPIPNLNSSSSTLSNEVLKKNSGYCNTRHVI